MAQVNVRNRKRSDGSNNWEYRFEGASIGGKRKQISKSGFKTKKDALEAGNKALAEYNRAGQVFIPSEMSYSDYLDYWIANYCEKNCSDNTTASYNSVINNHIKPALGGYKLNAIDHETIQNYINDIACNSGFKPSYVNTFRKVFLGSFKFACQTAKFIQSNPAENLRVPNMAQIEDEGDYKILSKEEVERILDRFKNKPEQYYPILIAYNTGLRVSEVYGLTWDRVDLERNIITVDRIIKHFEYENRKDRINTGKNDKLLTRWLLGECKTKSSVRKISIGKSLHDALVTLKLQQEEDKKYYAEYYTRIYLKDEISRNGKPVKRLIQETIDIPLDEADFVIKKRNGETTGTTSMKYASKIINKELGIEFCFHALRHTHATMLIESGIPINQVSKRLGHSSSRITWDIYVGASSNLDEEVASVFDEKNAILTTN